MRFRTRTTDVPCPKCGPLLVVVEKSIAGAELDEPQGWGVVERRCPKGCVLTASDFGE
jgi:hypothetical protein